MNRIYFFVVILGETDSSNYQKEKIRLKSLGEVEKLTERTYGLLIKSAEEPDRKKLRSIISGDEKFITLIIQIKPRTGISWCLHKAKSAFLTDIYQTLIKELEDEQKEG